jgi:quinol-cytochrome oxidoreductase complex cytochrome b subunit
MKKPREISSEIESELISEVQLELEKRGLAEQRQATEDTAASLLAGALLACLAVLAGSGLVMAMGYVPSADDAAASVDWFSRGPWGALTRGMHHHGANLAVLLSLSYLGYLLWQGLFRRPATGRWWRAALLLALLVGFDFTGQLLPFDQQAVHGTAIRVGYLAQAPVVGPWLKELMLGGDAPGTAGLARFYALHILVLPALALLLCRWVMRDAGTRGGWVPHFGVAACVIALLGLVALGFPVPPGLSGDINEAFPDARPEWYALPLYSLLQLLPAGVMQLAVLFLPPLAGAAAVVMLPMLETTADLPARLGTLVKGGVIATGLGALVLAALPMIADHSQGAGWYRRPTVEALMTDISRRNDRLLHGSEELPADAHRGARDLAVLLATLAGTFPDDLEEGQREDWRKWSNEGEAAARAILTANSAAEQREAREALRKSCANCHEAHEQQDARIEPPPQAAARGARDAGAVAAPRPRFFDPERLEELRAGDVSRLSGKRAMDQARLRLWDILRHAGVSSGEPVRDKEQALVELRALIAHMRDLYPEYEADFYEERTWREFIEATQAALGRLAEATDARDVALKARVVGDTCEACHDGADERLRDIEWTYSRFLR